MFVSIDTVQGWQGGLEQFRNGVVEWIDQSGLIYVECIYANPVILGARFLG